MRTDFIELDPQWRLFLVPPSPPSPGPGGGYDWSLPGLWPLEVTNGLDSHSRPEVDSLLYDFHVRCILSADVLPTLTTLIPVEKDYS